ncbi:MAG: hypothetical protein AVDCRST_MAG06-796 [uncultured Nocardioides sp.]|uniref:Uncharacterized protein n=1 Tax=uncultured Nocardioides sp. TaxID=198441 RepID=A0A6J4N6B6_9ACTN|nr:MAG: hypothetical protein AVDCRST_MAG06-796 [uncultured Nocardioides sp.]
MTLTDIRNHGATAPVAVLAMEVVNAEGRRADATA